MIEQLFLYFIILFLGLEIGSFLNCVIYRLYKKESFVKGRSYCPSCKHTLSWQDLIPIFSFLLLRGRCRYCHKKISWQYPLVEFATGILFILTFYYFFPTTLVQYLIIACLLSVIGFLVIIFVYDFKHFIILDKVIYPAIGAALLYRLFEVCDLGFAFASEFGIWNFKQLIYALVSAFFASSFFLAIFLISRGRWIGFGDVKLAVLMGLLLGFPNILIALFFAFFIGAIIGIGLIIFGGKKIKSQVPFAPFLTAGTIFALFFGKMTIEWYLSLIF